MIALGAVLSLTMACGGGATETGETESMEDMTEAAGEAMEDASEAVGGAVEDVAMQFESEVQAKLTTIQRGMDNLRSQASEYGDDARQQANQVLGPLTEQSRAIEQDLEALKDQSGESMEQMRAGIESAVAELERAYQEARDQLRQ